MATTNTTKPRVLITGCSEGGIGAALAVAFHTANYHVYATARDAAKMEGLKSQGIETLVLDTLSDESIAECVKNVSSLDMLVNNAGKQFLMPVVDIDITEAKKVYDLNVWSHIAVTQAFLPLLLKSKGTIVNQTSVGASVSFPLQAVYNSSKAAMSMISNSLRLELEPFGIKVVELRTGVVKTNLIKNLQDHSTSTKLPEGSIYEPVRDTLERILRQEEFKDTGMPVEQWAEATVRDLSKKSPRKVIWRGESSLACWVLSLLPHGWADSLLKKSAGLDSIDGIPAPQ